MQVQYTQALIYTNDQPDLIDFRNWLRKLITTEDFTRRSSRYVEIYRQLKTETHKESRRRLVQEAFQLQGAPENVPQCATGSFSVRRVIISKSLALQLLV
jgi:hypothetical protein